MLIHFPALIDTDGTKEFPEQCGVILLAFQSQVGIPKIKQVTVCPSSRLKVQGIYAFAALVSPPQDDVAR